MCHLWYRRDYYWIPVAFNIQYNHAYFYYLVTLSMIIFCIGCGICQAVIFNASLNTFPKIKGTVSSAVSFVRFFTMAIFTGLMSYVYNGQAIKCSYSYFFFSSSNLLSTCYFQGLEKSIITI